MIGALVVTHRKLRDLICYKMPIPIVDLIQLKCVKFNAASRRFCFCNTAPSPRFVTRTLTLSDCELTCVEASVLARCLEVNFIVTRLDLSKNNISKYGAHAFKVENVSDPTSSFVINPI